MHIPNNLTNNVGYVMSTSEVMRGHSDQQRLEIGQHWKYTQGRNICMHTHMVGISNSYNLILNLNVI